MPPNPHRPRHFRRTSAYNPALDPLLLRWAAQRHVTLNEAAKRIGVSHKRLRQWIAQHPEMSAAFDTGRFVADAKVVEALYQLALGAESTETQREETGPTNDGKFKIKKRNHKHAPFYRAAKLWLQNRLPAEWSANPKPRKEELTIRVRRFPNPEFPRGAAEPRSES